MKNIQKRDLVPDEGTVEAIDPFASPPPGYSLTQKESNFPWENPPEIANPEEALDIAIDTLELPKNQNEMFKLMTAGVSIEVLVEGYVMEGFQSGKFSADTGALIKTPLSLYMTNLAEENGIAYRLFEKDDPFDADGMNDREFFELLKINNPKMFSKIKEDIAQKIREGDTSQVSEKQGGIL